MFGAVATLECTSLQGAPVTRTNSGTLNSVNRISVSAMHLQSNAGGKTLPIEVIPVASCYDNNWSQYLGGGLTGLVTGSSIQAMQSII